MFPLSTAADAAASINCRCCCCCQVSRLQRERDEARQAKDHALVERDVALQQVRVLFDCNMRSPAVRVRGCLGMHWPVMIRNVALQEVGAGV